MSLLAELTRVLSEFSEEAKQIAAIEAIPSKLSEDDRDIHSVVKFMGAIESAASPAVKDLMIEKFAAHFVHDLADLHFALDKAGEDHKLILLRAFDQRKIETFNNFIRVLDQLSLNNRVEFLRIFDQKKLRSLIANVSNLLEFSTFVERNNVVRFLGLDFISRFLIEPAELKKEIDELPSVIAKLKEGLALVNELTLVEQELTDSMQSIGDAADAAQQLVSIREQLQTIKGLKNDELHDVAVQCEIEPDGFDQEALAAHLLAAEAWLKHVLHQHAHPLNLDDLAQTLAAVRSRKAIVSGGAVREFEKPLIKDELSATIQFFYKELIQAGHSFEDISLDRVDLIRILKSLSEADRAAFLGALSDKKLIELIPSVNVLKLLPSDIRGVVFARLQGLINPKTESDQFWRLLNDLESPDERFQLLNTLTPGSLKSLVNTEVKLFSLLKHLDAEYQFIVLDTQFSPEYLAPLLKESLSLDKDSFKAKIAELDPSIRRNVLAAMAMAYQRQRSSVGRQYMSAGGRLFGFSEADKVSAAGLIVTMLHDDNVSVIEGASAVAKKALVTGNLAKIYEAAHDFIEVERQSDCYVTTVIGRGFS